MDVLTQWFADSKCVDAHHRVTMEALGYILYDAPSSMRVVKNGGDMYVKLKRELVDWIEYKDQVSPLHTHIPLQPLWHHPYQTYGLYEKPSPSSLPWVFSD